MKDEAAQVGGDHYQMAIQPIEFINSNDLPYCEGNVVKYVSRHRNKNGAEDVTKALHYTLFILRDRYGVLDDNLINEVMATVKSAMEESSNE